MDNVLQSFHSGKRLQIARQIKSLRLFDLADAFNVDVSTIQKWQGRRIPQKSIAAVSFYFNVEEWVFLDETLSEEDFKKIINNPTLMAKYRPDQKREGLIGAAKHVFSFEGEPKPKGQGRIHKSDIFKILSSSVLIRARIWGAKGITYTQIALVEKDRYTKDYGMKGSAALPKIPGLTVFTSKDTIEKDEIIEENILNRIKIHEYYLHVASDHFFEINVFENQKTITP